ncbi:MAG: STAS domain-containing protein [Gemmatimonadota bacterium]|nr:STAS domain-containing protein [Gemmatimonadota bacterium]
MSRCAEFSTADRTLILRDRVTIADAGDLHAEALRAAGCGTNVRIDASELQLLDTAAAQVLIALQGALATRGHQLEWSGIAEAPARHLARGGLLPLLNAAHD